MKISWNGLKVSIAGAKLSHLVQKDKIWDHGSMTEQARIIFHLVQKAKRTGNIESLKKQCTGSCFEKITFGMEQLSEYKESLTENAVIKELAIVEVQQGKKNRPDMFSALIKGCLKAESYEKNFIVNWSFIRQGDWWVLDEMKIIF